MLDDDFLFLLDFESKFFPLDDSDLDGDDDDVLDGSGASFVTAIGTTGSSSSSEGISPSSRSSLSALLFLI